MMQAQCLEEIQKIRELVGDRRVAFVSGNFNLLHPGHLRLLRFARECADVLVVGVLDSSSPGAFVEASLRLESLLSITWVDYALLLTVEVTRCLEALRPAIVVKGQEWLEAENLEAAVVESYGGRLVFGSGDAVFSTIDVLKRKLDSMEQKFRIPHGYLKRHGISGERLKDLQREFLSLRVAVIGDAIVDEYLTCEALGMSQEEPALVVTPVATDRFIGGAAIVAAHARKLGAEVRFFSAIGNDEAGRFLAAELDALGINHRLYLDATRPTTVKRRYRAANRTLLRVSHLRTHSISPELREQVYADFSEALEQADLVIYSDFNYGVLPQALVDRLRVRLQERELVAVADSQSSSQLGDISRFQGMHLITPTEREARVSVHDHESGLVVLAEKVRERARAHHVVLTLGAEGILIHAPDTATATDRIPALNPLPVDVAGAGDSFLTACGMTLAARGTIWEAAYLGALAAACQVARLGNVPVSAEELATQLRLAQ